MKKYDETHYFVFLSMNRIDADMTNTEMVRLKEQFDHSGSHIAPVKVGPYRPVLTILNIHL